MIVQDADGGAVGALWVIFFDRHAANGIGVTIP